jgi:hypothetical protein
MHHVTNSLEVGMLVVLHRNNQYLSEICKATANVIFMFSYSAVFHVHVL